MENATFGGGCFWCTEAIFKRLRGVEKVLPGYSGGNANNPSYEEVSSGITGHAECIQIKFNPNIISYKKLLKIFFYTHDPTTINRQGNDIGTQYRSVIFFHNNEQQKIANEYMNELEENKVFQKPIVTAIEQFNKFYVAEDYHKNYYDKNKNAPYCNLIIMSKLNKFVEEFNNEVKDEYK
jgi:peptide-methionine (S)-S-oxide reductase